MESKRNTEQKRIIMEALKKADHPTAGELYDMVRGENPRISRATVFRVLSQFADYGEAIRVGLQGSGARYDANVRPHAHCYCLNCGKVVDFSDDKIAGLLLQRSVGGFEVLSAEIEFDGLCPECSAKKNLS